MSSKKSGPVQAAKAQLYHPLTKEEPQHTLKVTVRPRAEELRDGRKQVEVAVGDQRATVSVAEDTFNGATGSAELQLSPEEAEAARQGEISLFVPETSTTEAQVIPVELTGETKAVYYPALENEHVAAPPGEKLFDVLTENACSACDPREHLERAKEEVEAEHPLTLF